MIDNLAVDDQFYRDMKVYFKNTGDKAAMQLEKLTDNLRSVCEQGVTDGQTAEALKQLLERVSELSDLTVSFSSQAADLMDSFIKRIDKIDNKLY